MSMSGATIGLLCCRTADEHRAPGSGTKLSAESGYEAKRFLAEGLARQRDLEARARASEFRLANCCNALCRAGCAERGGELVPVAHEDDRGRARPGGEGLRDELLALD
jgi:hypothetical protein